MPTAIAVMTPINKNKGFAKIAFPKLIIVLPKDLTELIALPNVILLTLFESVDACLLAVSKSIRANDAPTSPRPSPKTENPLLSARMSTCLSTPMIV